ncbi:unnamed protein product [Gongylonema pulchrum]|uniref:Transmembrane transport n=1 Tax=Gongylonema pulchrum TaxID=637853 RepID=A0A183E9L0_9BILA|nr:unnamed protein product [Gongylonema pulchrum]
MYLLITGRAGGYRAGQDGMFSEQIQQRVGDGDDVKEPVEDNFNCKAMGQSVWQPHLPAIDAVIRTSYLLMPHEYTRHSGFYAGSGRNDASLKKWLVAQFSCSLSIFPLLNNMAVLRYLILPYGFANLARPVTGILRIFDRNTDKQS